MVSSGGRRRLPCVRCHGSRRFFFFQAEDGIRDVAVTGVQTCALPISIADSNIIDSEHQSFLIDSCRLSDARHRAGFFASSRLCQVSAAKAGADWTKNKQVQPSRRHFRPTRGAQLYRTCRRRCGENRNTCGCPATNQTTEHPPLPAEKYLSPCLRLIAEVPLRSFAEWTTSAPATEVLQVSLLLQTPAGVPRLGRFRWRRSDWPPGPRNPWHRSGRQLHHSLHSSR